MDFGLIYEIQVPRPWHVRKEADLFQAIVRQAVLAEQVGFSHFWAVEHHFAAEYSHSSAPEVILGAAAAVTKDIRIGHAARLLPHKYNHPVRSAEAAATLDVISNGRLEFGTARSSSRLELEGFGIAPDEARAMWEESLKIVVDAWTQETIAVDGKYVQIPPRCVVPKPLQRPHPPLWVASGGPESHEMAGRMGLGLLSFALGVSTNNLASRLNLYREALRSAKPVGKKVNGKAAVFTLVHVAPTDAEAYARAEEGFMWYIEHVFGALAELAAWQTGKPTTSYDYLKMMKVNPEEMTFRYMVDNDRIVVGSPETCARKVAAFEQTGADQLICLMQAGGMPIPAVDESIRLFGEQVIPRFR
jgi:alkanesulfonate monooxygenase SsuD/methylene tetrahydromethanopterin reductase-like flavin-dependent oxidoreductase (luciferase family)